jgi:UDP-N-acetylmuramyl tripeptide synthase
VAEDHLGEWGVWDIDTLVETKFVVARAVERSGVLVLNADDPRVLERGRRHPGSVAWFSLRADHPAVRAHVEAGGRALWLEDGRLVRRWDGRAEDCAAVADVPVFFGGAARHNLANALAAMGLGSALGLPIGAMARGLGEFRSDPADNPGRLNVFELGGVTALVDFAHNPHGFEALFDMVARLPSARRSVLLGQAGDRDDASIRELVRIAWRVAPERVFIKEMPAYLRGRELGDVPRLIEDELTRLGCPPERYEHQPTELDAMKAALRWARPGDVLLLLAHSERTAALELLRGLAGRGWKPGSALD